MANKKRNKFMTIIAMMVCMMLCIPNVSAFASGGVDRTSEGTFKVTDLVIDSIAGPQKIYENGSFVWDINDSIIITGGWFFDLKAEWKVADVTGWAPDDFLIFDLPMSDIVSYATGTGSLNSGYGTWEIFEDSGDAKVKFVLSANALLGNSLDNGLFQTMASIKNKGSNGTTGTTTIEDKTLDWEVYRWEGTSDTEYSAVQNMFKGVWAGVGSATGQFYFRAHATDYLEWFKETLNSTYTGNYEQKNNVVIVDEIPDDMEFVSLSSLEMTIRGPLVLNDGTIVQGNSQVQNFNVAGRPGVTITQTSGQSYADFYDLVTTSQAPCWGIHDNKTLVVNLGNLPANNTDENFLEVFNRLHGSTYATMESFLKSRLNATADSIGLDREARADFWLTTAADVYTDDMRWWDYTITFFTAAKWHDTDLDATQKPLSNTAKMTYNGSEEIEDSTTFQFHRTIASIQMKAGDLYLLKADSETGIAIDGVELTLHEYIGSESTIAGVRGDTAASSWLDRGKLITGAVEGTGAVRWENILNGFYKIVEVKAADGYTIGSFELFSEGKATSHADGVFEMPADAGLKVIAENTKTTAGASIEVTKTLTGRPLVAGEFTFEVYNESGVKVATATNAVDGKVAFGPIAHNAVGTYKYTIKELVGTLVGVTYDTKEIEVTVVVTKDVSGVWQTAVSYPSSGATFANSYTPGGGGGGSSPTGRIQLEATKTLTGRTLNAGEFTFEVFNEGGVKVGTATNGANGHIVFPAISYTSSGTYKYTIKEVQGSLTDVTYDTTQFEVTVVVTNIGGSTFQVVATYPTGGVAFENTYDKPTIPPEEEEPEEPPVIPETPETSDGEETPNYIDISDGNTPLGDMDGNPQPGGVPAGDAPQTGDTNNLAGFAILALLSVAGLTVVTRRCKMN